MQRVTKVLLGALVALPLAGMAQEAVEDAAAVKWERSISLGATYRDGNTQKSLYTMNLKGDRYSETYDIVSSLYAEYGKTATPTEADPNPEKQQTEGQARGQSQYRYKFGGKNFFGGVFGEGYYDDMKNIRTRLKLGPNIGYYFINQENMKLDASIGLNYVYERVSTGEDTYGEYRASLNYLWNITEKSTYYLNLEYTANMDDVDVDNNGLLVTGVRSTVYEDIAMFIELRDEYDNSPAAGVVEYNDLTILAGLSYAF
jgi:hypothetical protein